MTFFDPNESLGFHCSITYKAFVSTLEGKLKSKGIKGSGISTAQHVALAHLIASGPISQSDLAARLAITRATGVRLIDRMERDGWVVRQPDPEDGRVNLVVPTKRSTEVWDDVCHISQELVEQAYQGIDPAEIESVKRILEKVRKNLGS